MDNKQISISTEQFEYYLRKAPGIIAVNLIEFVESKGRVSTLKYFRSLDDYKRSFPESKVSRQRYDELFGDMEKIETLLLREPVRILKNVPQMDEVRLFAPLDGQYYICRMSRPAAEKAFQISLKDLGESDGLWIKFVEKNILNEKKRKQYSAIFIEKAQ